MASIPIRQVMMMVTFPTTGTPLTPVRARTLTIACLLNRVRFGKVIDTSTELVDRIEDAFKGLEVDDKMPSLRESHLHLHPGH